MTRKFFPHIFWIGLLFVFISSSPGHANTKLNYQDDQTFAEFNRASDLLKAGAVEDADKIVDDALQSSLGNEELRAGFNYLKGQIVGLGEPEDGIVFMERAHNIYTELKKKEGVYTTGLVLVSMYVTAQRVSEAEGLLAILQNDFPSLSKPYVYYLQSSIQFLKGDYLLAQKYAQQCYDAYLEPDPRRAAQAQGKLGMYKILNGDLEGGNDDTIEAQGRMMRHGDTDQFYHSQISLILLRKCQDKDASTMVKIVEERLSESPDKELSDLLSFALEFVCQ